MASELESASVDQVVGLGCLVNGVVLFDPTKVRIERYRYRGNRIPNPYDLTITA